LSKRFHVFLAVLTIISLLFLAPEKSISAFLDSSGIKVVDVHPKKLRTLIKYLGWTRISDNNMVVFGLDAPSDWAEDFRVFSFMLSTTGKATKVKTVPSNSGKI